MNVLFVMYGDLGGNSAVPMGLYSRELAGAGHACAVAVAEQGDGAGVVFHGRVATHAQALARPEAVFPDGRAADVVHAWTPRENVRRFVTAWMARFPAPLVMYLEDNEGWIAQQVLGVADAQALLSLSDAEIDARLPDVVSHPFRFESFIGLADAVVVLQDKLAAEVPPWVPCHTVLPAADLVQFAPRAPDAALRRRHGVAEGERVLVYPGGLNAHTRPGMHALCRAVGLLNAQGQPCRLLRTGPQPLDFLEDLPREARAAISDLGVLPRSALPELLSLADVLVQPGKRDPFEELRLPGKLPEFLASGKPVVLPDAGVAHMLADGENVLLTQTGTAEEIARKCREVFEDPVLARRLGEGARRFAEGAFDPRVQAGRLLAVYEQALRDFDVQVAARVWGTAQVDTPPAELLALRLQALADAPRLAVALDPRALLRACERLCLQAQARAAALQARAVAAGRGAAPAAPRLLGYASAGGRQAMAMARRVQGMVRRKGGARGFAAAAWRIAADEGWEGVRRRTAWIYRPHPESRASVPTRPLISLVMSASHPQQRWVETTISSMQAQVYARWELCIAAEASAAPELRAMLSRHAAADSRIRPLFVPDTERSPHACHAALRNAAGEWIALLEQGHVLAESALAQVAEVVGRDPGLRLVFADGEPSAHLRVYRADLLREVAGSTPGLAGAHDADLPLHCVERLQPRQMHHIPGVLHRWQPDE